MATFLAAIDGTIQNETGGDITGGYTNRVGDWGGPTKWGVSQLGTKLNTGTAWSVDQIKTLSLQDAISYYLKFYWNQLYGLILNQDVASKLFDTGVVCGPESAITICQHALRVVGKPLNVDGKFGAQTLAGINTADSIALLSAMCFQQLVHFEAIIANHPDQACNRHMWEVRSAYLQPKKETP